MTLLPHVTLPPTRCVEGGDGDGDAADMVARDLGMAGDDADAAEVVAAVAAAEGGGEV